MDIDDLLDQNAQPPCRADIHNQTPDQLAIIRRARERHQQGIPNPDNPTLSELCGISISAVRRYLKSGCGCDS